MHVSKCLSPNRADFCAVDRAVFEIKKRKQEARKIAIITEHKQFVFVPFSFNTKYSTEILSTKHHPLYICIHGIEWRWLLLMSLVLLLSLQRLCALQTKYILLEFL